MLSNRQRSYGTLNTTIYDFTQKGDILDMHVHGTEDVHISIVGRGSFRVFGPDFELVALTGSVIDWQPGQWHGFEALEDDSRLINVVKA